MSKFVVPSPYSANLIFFCLYKTRKNVVISQFASLVFIAGPHDNWQSSQASWDYCQHFFISK
uniref:Uncharacterized protein n=1 Tax=Rhizophora mucronata TaxID=61149 RepID=A0A2P2IL36_RHIMU